MLPSISYEPLRQHFSWSSSIFPLASILSIKPEIVTAHPTFRCLQMRIFCDLKMVLFLFQFQNSLNHSALSCEVDPNSHHVTLQSNTIQKAEIWEIHVTVTKKLYWELLLGRNTPSSCTQHKGNKTVCSLPYTLTVVVLLLVPATLLAMQV